MKDRTKPKIWLKREIFNPANKREKIGYINLVSYLTKEDTSHIEFEIEDAFAEYRGKRIMSVELPKYLKLCKKWGHAKLIACVKKDNAASIKLLEKNDFIKIVAIDDNYCYLTDLALTKSKIRKMQELIACRFNLKKY